MTKRYQLQDAEQWAAFSGDHNPIHFSLEAARPLGLNALCIHGMRAMLDIKAALSAQAQSTQPHGQSFLFSCRLDKPVYYQHAYKLKTEQLLLNQKQQMRSALLDEANLENCIHGKLVSVPAILQSLADEDGQISCEEMAVSLERLSAMAGQKPTLWNALDCMLFKQLIHSPVTMCRIRELIPEFDCLNLMAIFNKVQIVQTHHETHFIPSLLVLDDVSVFNQPLRFSILPTLVAGKSKAGFILRVSIQAFVEETVLIKSTVTLKATIANA